MPTPRANTTTSNCRRSRACTARGTTPARRTKSRFAGRPISPPQHLKPFGFSVIQIDDKWQDGVSRDGPKRIFTRHRADGPYPSGMKATADYIKSRGLTPGLWYMPYAATSYDPYYADKQQLFAMKDGKPFEVRGAARAST